MRHACRPSHKAYRRPPSTSMCVGRPRRLRPVLRTAAAWATPLAARAREQWRHQGLDSRGMAPQLSSIGRSELVGALPERRTHARPLTESTCPAAHVLASLAPSPLPCAILYASPTLRALLRELTCCSLIHRRRLHHSLRERVSTSRDASSARRAHATPSSVIWPIAWCVRTFSHIPA